MYYSATYDPGDDKLRLSATDRLDDATYKRVKARGFHWAPKQQVFYAVWSPGREDLLIELAGEIEDEDTSLVDRAEQRAERFEGYQDNRKRDAEAAHKAVSAIADGIPLGQPILVGHHSEKRARRDAQKIEDGMRKAVRMWDTAKYWQDRAQSALHHAKYLERPDVRYRRIKTIEADLRRQEKGKREAEDLIKLWTAQPVDLKRALAITNSPHCYYSRSYPLSEFPRQPPASQYEGDMSLWSALEGGVITPQQAKKFSMEGSLRIIKRANRWIDHLKNRIAYERAMLGEQGGTAADRYELAIGGRVLGRRGTWYVITKLNRKGDEILSVSTNGGVVGVEDIKDYRPPAEGDAEKVKAATKLPPMCNYPGENFMHMTKAEWDKLYKDYKGSEVLKATEEGQYGTHRVRRRFGVGFKQHLVYLTDSKRIDPPAKEQEKERPVLPKEKDLATALAPPPKRPEPEKTDFDAMKEQLRSGGVQVVSANQLFPTPAALAERMAQYAEILPGMSVMDPEAGTGRILAAVQKEEPSAQIFGVEINHKLAEALSNRFTPAGEDTCRTILQGDFLDIAPDQLGYFDRIVMNPPFENGQDIAHIRHAYRFLKPGGILVAIACEGPFYRSDKQSETFRDWLTELQESDLLDQPEDGLGEKLPRDTFESEGTSTATRLLKLRAPDGEMERVA